MKLIICCLVSTLCFKGNCLDPANLEAYGADKNKVTASGFSAGASMATQYHLAFSSIVKGAGIIAGAPYYCAKNYGWLGIFKCWTFAIPNSMDETVQVINNYENLRLIDPISNLVGHNVFIYNGKRDIFVNPANGPHIAAVYRHFNSSVLTDFTLDAQHAMPTNNYGNPCLAFFPPFISNCNYDGAYWTLNHLYGNITKPNGTAQVAENLKQFDQNEFNKNVFWSSMDTLGYIYVPTHCQTNKGCRLHIVFHGCTMGRQLIGELFVRHSGYNAVAELNNIIVLYPQIAVKFYNPICCFDWVGFTGSNYATKEGKQMKAIYDMMTKVLS